MRMRILALLALTATVGCTVHEDRRPPPPPGPAVVYEPAPAPPVEVIPVAPGPEFVWVPGGYVRERGGWVLHRGFYRRRY